MPKFNVSSIGFYCLDILGRPVTHIPEGGRADFIDEIRMTVAGTAGATAMCCGILGLKTRAVTRLGDDEMGSFLVTKLNGYGVNTDLVSLDASVQTSASILPVRPNGERPALHVPGTAATFDIDWEVIDDILDADIVHIGGTGLLKRFDGRSTQKLLKVAKDRGKVVTFDLIQANPETWKLVEPMLPYVDYFIPSIEEASELSGESDPVQAADFFQQKGVKNCILTLGGDGVYVSPENREGFFIPAYDIEVVDTTGCGDSFTAGIITGLSEGWPLRESAMFASAVAAKVAMGLGSDGKLISLEDTSLAISQFKIRK